MHNSTMRSTEDMNEILKRKCTLTDDEGDPVAEEDRLRGCAGGIEKV